MCVLICTCMTFNEILENVSHWGSYLILKWLQYQVLIRHQYTQLVTISRVQVFLCQNVPVLCGVSNSSDELYSFGVVVDLRVESKIPLDKVSWGHEPLSILVCYAGILRIETRHKINIKKNSFVNPHSAPADGLFGQCSEA